MRQIGKDPAGPLAMAFATVERERFLGPPPWRVRGRSFGVGAETSELPDIYSDVLVALDRQRGINNGSPSLHACGIDWLQPQPGERIAHIGAGTGYYSAIFAELVGSAGSVTAVELDAQLAARARIALSGYDTVTVIEGDGAEKPEGEVDIVYVNFACDRPADPWIERLAPGGRLLFPLGVPVDAGESAGPRFTDRAAYLLIRREADGFSAQFLKGVSFIWGEGELWRSRDRQDMLNRAFRARRLHEVRTLRWKRPRPVAGPPEWYGEADWGLEFGSS
ncbi:protein-L-isoaspartate O-methyltransferase family protein [Rhizobium halophytocola]|uniref:Protein-L-isoaspartate O-methyltransferase n=1 Tax=Rhizobium halophytocola TaxID=735519 RepID=A0ABS4DYM9_9HYPH|nr:rRNA adenine N-6-methyltransferase family protein [Rhizobium halophytocola]MBP1850798.1 protein-L-isoaspartate(D-aspartate) O-methyltransferase [Rhizobium halophytocola]